MPNDQNQKCTFLYGYRRKEIRNQVVYGKVLIQRKTIPPRGWEILSHHFISFLTL